MPRPTLGARMAEAMGYGHKHHGAATSLQASVRHRQASKVAAARRATLAKLGQQSSARFGSAGRPWRDDDDSDGGGFERDDDDDGGGAAFGFGDSARGALSSPPGVRDDVDADWFGAVWKPTAGLGGPDQTSEFSSSIKSKSIRLIFGRIDGSRRVFEAQSKSLRRNCRICAR